MNSLFFRVAFCCLVSVSGGVVGFWAALCLSSIFFLRLSISCLIDTSSAVFWWPCGSLLVTDGGPEWSLPASVTDILISYANLMIFCLLAKMGHAAVPAAWSLFEHVGHFLVDLHWESSSCVKNA